MGLGYGSEYQLMRFLGHHRDLLNKLILEAVKTHGNIEWIDFHFDSQKDSGDGEWKGITCFSKLKNYSEIKLEWKKFWPQRGTAMNWDGIFRIGDTWYFLEAKAHKSESFQNCSAKSEESIATIENAFIETQRWLKLKDQKKWIESNCYQLANRLAFLCFCEKCGIKARLVYIGFVNGFRNHIGEVHSVKEWMEIWENELDELGLKLEEMTPFISFVHPNCDPKRKNK